MGEQFEALNVGIAIEELPKHVRAAIAELELELAEGDVTQKGFEKKIKRLVFEYLPRNGKKAERAEENSAAAQSRKCRSYKRRYTRDENRYHSELRQEAVQLALFNAKDIPVLKNTRRNTTSVKPTGNASVLSSSEDEDESTTTDQTLSRDSSLKSSEKDINNTSTIPLYENQAIIGSLTKKDESANCAVPSNGEDYIPISICRNNHESINVSEQEAQPPPMPDFSEFINAGMNGSLSESLMTNLDEIDTPISGKTSRVSAKIQNLLNTLAKPKKKPLQEYYEDEDAELEIAASVTDPSAPKAEGITVSPFFGNSLSIPNGLPTTLEEALARYNRTAPKTAVATVLNSTGRGSTSITYSKLFTKVRKVAYTLLNKLHSKSDGRALVKAGDRVALVFPNNDPLSFMCAFHGCLLAGVVPVAIEVPTSKRDAGLQPIGFLLGSCDVKVALTSEMCHKGLPKAENGDVSTFKGWPMLHWLVIDECHRVAKDWKAAENLNDDSPAYIEYTYDRNGSVMGVSVSRSAMLNQCRALVSACNYCEGESMVCVIDFKREIGLWHAILCSVLVGMQVTFVPYALMKVQPGSWMLQTTKIKASVAMVKSRDLHWGVLAQRDHREVNLSSLRILLVADGCNPWSLTSCDQFLQTFQSRGLRPDSICPCAASPEALTISIRRPTSTAPHSSGRGILSMNALSHGVVRVEKENTLTSLTLQDCGQVLPDTALIVLRCDTNVLCQTDEVGEICISSNACGKEYWGLSGVSTSTFKVQPKRLDGSKCGDRLYVRSGMLGFIGPGGLVFVCGSRSGLMRVSGRRHNTDDIVATILAVEPMKFIYRGRIAVFSIRVLRDERICVVAEQKPDCTEEESFAWMSRVLQAVDGIHQVGIYCLALLPANQLPKTALGGIHLSEAKKKFLSGLLHPSNVLLAPHTCVTNLPKPREKRPEVGPASIMVGAILQGVRMAEASGRELGPAEEESSSRYQFIAEILRWRAGTTPEHVLFTANNFRGAADRSTTCMQLHKKAEKIAVLLQEKAKVVPGDHVALVFPPGIDLIYAFYGCLYAGCIPVPIRPFQLQSLAATLPTVRMIADVSKSVALLTTTTLSRVLKSKEAAKIVDYKVWPPIIDTDENIKRKFTNVYCPPSSDMICYLDFSVSTTGTLTGVKVSHSAVTNLCRSLKLQCELYPSRHICVSLDPYSGLGLSLWCIASVYAGHHTMLIAPSEVEMNSSLLVSTISHHRIRDTFCSYGVIELTTRGLASAIPMLKERNINLSCLRSCVIVAEERPRLQLTTSFSKLFSSLGLSARAVSTSFGCRANIAVGLQGASGPDPSTVFVDLRALRNDRVTVVERGSPHSLCLLESGKLMPGVKVVIADPETKGHCSDSHLGEIWINSMHNSSGYFAVFGVDQTADNSQFSSRLSTGDTRTQYARTGYLGFLRRTEAIGSEGEPHDALFVVGSLEETMTLRGMRFHPIDIESSILKVDKRICECAVFTWTNLLVIVCELDAPENEALDTIIIATNTVLEEHHLIAGIVVIVDPGAVPINSKGEKQRMHLRDSFLADQLDPVYVAYNM